MIHGEHLSPQAPFLTGQIGNEPKALHSGAAWLVNFQTHFILSWEGFQHESTNPLWGSGVYNFFFYLFINTYLKQR